MAAVALSVVLASLAAASPLVAQRRAAFTVEGGIGIGRGEAATETVNQTGAAAVGTIAWRGGTARRSGVLIAGEGVWQGRGGHQDLCEPQPSGACAGNFPSFMITSLLGGWEFASGNGPSLRLLVGPGRFSGGEGPDAFGMSGRIDLATAVRGRLALVGTGRMSHTSGNVAGYSLASITLGVRIH